MRKADHRGNFCVSLLLTYMVVKQIYILKINLKKKKNIYFVRIDCYYINDHLSYG